MLFKILIYAQVLKKKQAPFRPAPISHEREHYVENNQGLVFLKSESIEKELSLFQ